LKTLGLATTRALLFAQPSFAQDAPPAVTSDPSDTASADGQTHPADSTPPPGQPTEGPLSRWPCLNRLSFGYRYRGMENGDGSPLFDSGQERSLIDGRFKLDAEPKSSTHFHISSLRNFNLAYADNRGRSCAEPATASVAGSSPTQLKPFLAAIFADPAGYTDIQPILAIGFSREFTSG